jgi:hypothetical protein
MSELDTDGASPVSIINRHFQLDQYLEPFASQRHGAFAAIVRDATQMLAMNPELHTPMGAEPETWHVKLYEAFCRTYAKELAKRLQVWKYQHMVIGIDECRHWDEAYYADRGHPNHKMSLVALNRIIKAADSFQVELLGFTYWFTLLDTSSSVFDLVLRRENAPSNRLASTLDPAPIWPYLGFNQMVESQRQTPQSAIASQTPDHACTIEWLQMYGRPVRCFQSQCFCDSCVESFGQLKHQLPFGWLLSPNFSTLDLETWSSHTPTNTKS